MAASVTVTPGRIQKESEMRKSPTSASASHSGTPATSMQEDIAKLAYALWQQRGCPQGSADEDWLEAERKLRESSEHVTVDL
jgi:Protein of unknown function (DUF2934)